MSTHCLCIYFFCVSGVQCVCFRLQRLENLAVHCHVPREFMFKMEVNVHEIALESLGYYK